LYYCLALFFSESRVSASRVSLHSLCSLLGSYLGIHLDACAGLRLSKNFFFRFRFPSSGSPRSFRKRVQKYYLFTNPQAVFSKNFHLFIIKLIVSEKNFSSK